VPLPRSCRGADLWGWHGHYSQRLPKYSQRREYIAELAAPAREALEAIIEGVKVHDPGSSGEVSWASLDALSTGSSRSSATPRPATIFKMLAGAVERF
jgi:hypothetical protein